ncbi:hypothetical protein [Aneurinibacillus migulanus]|uniref:hypothetical protein n=1 Tax=Aneurinibacillus migulanus TaxID=47500 RepID=UPI0011146779|nr:hypothetical protein [Aneurinibacillus migulanus]MED0892601.1 hypothetical protein [Aneurinibacillus migulanus]MED1614985.1 hypothetical protein [Aneurinibacillus migulanus]
MLRKIYLYKGVNYPVRARVASHHTVPQTGRRFVSRMEAGESRFLPWPGGTAKHLGRREERDNCCPLSPGREKPTRVPFSLHYMDNP